MRRRHILRAGVGLGMVHAAAPFVHAQANRAMIIGQSAALSGPASELGEQFRKGALLVFERVNAQGGVAGRPLELRTLDDGYEPDRCVANTKKFIEARAFALFGYIGTPTSLAALPLATAAKLPFVAPFTGAAGLREPFNRYAFHVRASYDDETAEIIKQTTAVGIRRIGVFHQDDSYGQAGLAGVTRALKARGLQPVSLGKVARNSEDVAAAVQSILVGRPEAIVQISAYKSCTAFIRAARAAGFRGTFYNVSFVGTQALASALGSEAAGVVVSQVMPFPFSAATPLAGEFLAAGQGAWNDAFSPNYSAMEGYVAARVLVEGLRRAGTVPTPESLVTGLETMRELNLGGFFVDFSPQKHVGSRFVDLTILTSEGKVRR
jgi:branched-chain amino acid transport system substrate-binding protein